jgi:hypothetical protein
MEWTDLVLLLLRKYSLAIVLLFPVTIARAESYSSYFDAKSKIQELIGNAQKSIYLKSKLLTDGDIVMSLYIAKYRGIETKVVLERQASGVYLSRYRDLMRQGIPTMLKDSGWRNFPTSVVVDGKLYDMSTPLDYRIASKSFEVLEGSDANRDLILKDFAIPESFKISPPEKLLPPKLQKKPMANSRPQSDKGEKLVDTSNLDVPVSNLPEGSSNEPVGYRFKTERTSPPPGVDTKLPRKTKWQIKKENHH